MNIKLKEELESLSLEELQNRIREFMIPPDTIFNKEISLVKLGENE